VFRTGDKADFDRMLEGILSRARTAAAETAVQLEQEFALHGMLRSSGTPIEMERRITPIHELALGDSMRLIAQFSERTGVSVDELCQTAKPRLVTFASGITERIANAARHVNLMELAAQASERFTRRVENALRDAEIGFIQGRNVTLTESPTNQSKALQLLNAIYVKTHSRTDPVFISELETGLLEEDLKAAWRYLKDRGLIDTFNIAYTARINGRGIDAVESAHRHPDQTSSNFPSVTYNIVNNTVNVGTMNSSPLQQAGVQSKQHQMVNCSTQDLIDLKRMVNELAIHLDELQLDARQKQSAEAQIATLRAQLGDEPDPVIVNQAGRTLRNITEGAIGSLAATAAQPTVWVSVHEAMHRIFGS
jgi:hypothetical protein